ncbi:MAG TPA: hypothetical protein VIC85_10300 [Ktedonobacterales bacterium]
MDSTARNEATLDHVLARLADLETARATQSAEHDRLWDQIAALERENAELRRPTSRFARTRTPTRPQAPTSQGPRTSRRGVLGAAAKVAVATAAAGVLVEQVGTHTAFASGPGAFDSSVAGTPAASATGTSGAAGVMATSDTSIGVSGTTGASTSYGVYGSNTSNSASGIAVFGHSDDGAGGLGSGIGVQGETGIGSGVVGTATTGTGVSGQSTSGTGISATSSSGPGLVASSVTSAGLQATGGGGTAAAVRATGGSGAGVYATSTGGIGVYGTSAGGASTQAMYAVGTSGATGPRATSDTGNGLVALSTNGTGINVQSATGSAVVATSTGVGYGLHLTATSGWAIGCVGRIRVLGNAVETVTLTHGTTAKTVSSTACSGSSQVILTPTSNPQVAIWAVASPGFFTLHASAAPSADVTFSYFLIN